MEVFAPYSFILALLYFLTCLVLTIVWGCSIKRVNKKTMLETAIVLTVVFFNLVLLFQAIYMTLYYFGVITSEMQIYLVIDKFSEITSAISIYHFVLELQPIIVVLQADLTLEE